MIVTFIITTVINAVKLIASILPTVPDTPAAVVSAGQWVIDQIGNVISVLNMVFSPALLAAIMICVVGMFNFEWIYHSIMWIIRKIPMINMK